MRAPIRVVGPSLLLAGSMLLSAGPASAAESAGRWRTALGVLTGKSAKRQVNSEDSVPGKRQLVKGLRRYAGTTILSEHERIKSAEHTLTLVHEDQPGFKAVAPKLKAVLTTLRKQMAARGVRLWHDAFALPIMELPGRKILLFAEDGSFQVEAAGLRSEWDGMDRVDDTKFDPVKAVDLLDVGIKNIETSFARAVDKFNKHQLQPVRLDDHFRKD
jgi:hypothetical protein